MSDTAKNGTPAMIPVPGAPAAGVSVEFVNRVREWCEAHVDKVHRCVISRFEGHPVVFFIPKIVGYDYALSDLLVEFDMTLHRMGSPGRLIPLLGGKSAYSNWFEENDAIPVFGQDARLPGHAKR